MPSRGDIYRVKLRKAHLEWGTHRYTSSRGIVYGEGYIQLPVKYARQFDIYNSNMSGVNILYKCSSKDGFLKDTTLKAQGCSRAGEVYAKQFSAIGNLRIIGSWYQHVGAVVGGTVVVEWISSTEILVEYI